MQNYRVSSQEVLHDYWDMLHNPHFGAENEAQINI